jgi:NAD(P)-dependent dehydrogenase (short-subunit alcohol dehydrogenase family)
MTEPHPFNIENKTVIITGASRGIGKGIVQVLAEAGAQVLVTALTNRYLGPLADEMAAAGHPIETLQADATKTEDWGRTVNLALDRWGRIDALINNLGDYIATPLVPLPDTEGDDPLSDEVYRHVLDINLTQAVLGCRAVGPYMLKQRYGKVINISSASARSGAPGSLVYSTAKAGLVRLTQVLALEWAAYGITVNCIAPGSFPDAELTDPEVLAERLAQAKTNIPLGRPGQVREVGYLAQYMISDAANYMTGQTVYLDGGLGSM